jgi:ketosteroid isomerase-like protein
MRDANDTIEQYYTALGAGDIDGVLALYAEGAEIVRYDGVADTDAERRAYFGHHLVRNPGLSLNEIVAIRHADDVLMWDALINTDHGVVQVFHVVILDADGKFRRHIPGLRGYWGG